MKKVLLSLLATVALSSPAGAWPKTVKTFHVHNNTTINIGYPLLVIDGIMFEAAPFNVIPPFYPLPEVASRQSADFASFSQEPCMVWIVIYPKYGLIPPITAPNKFNRCSPGGMSHITVSDKGPPAIFPTVANYTFTYAP